MHRATILLALALGAFGCARPHGFDRGQLADAASQRAQVTDDDIRAALALRPQLPSPFRLGILFRNAVAWNAWSPEDKEQLIRAGDRLRASGIVSDVVPIAGGMVAGDDLKAFRYAAAQHGADAVLVVGGAAATDDYNNALGPLYVGIVTMFFVPGSVVDALYVGHAGLWDVRNGFLYAASEVDGRGSVTRPAFFSRAQDAVTRARADAASALATDVERRVRHLATGPARGQAN